jgi:hypothetical protein
MYVEAQSFASDARLDISSISKITNAKLDNQHLLTLGAPTFTILIQNTVEKTNCLTW